MAKNAGKNTQIVASVTGMAARSARTYTQFSIQNPLWSNTGGTNQQTASNIAAAGTNYLADGDFVVNITRGLTPKNTTLARG